MALEAWELAQRAKGNIAGVDQAKVLLAHYGDVPSPSGTVTRFTNGALKDIERNHGAVFDPLETSLARLVSARKPFNYIVHQYSDEFMNVTSRPSQVVIFPEPEKFYVPESNNLSLADQRSLQAVDTQEILKKKWGIGGVEEVIDNVATHSGLFFAHFAKTGGKVRLHGEDYGFRFARTETPTVGSRVASVGHFHADDGLFVGHWCAGYGANDLWAVRLGVPAQD